MSGTSTQNLGLVKAIHEGNTPPSNTAMLWRDTTDALHVTKQYDNVTDTWNPLGGSFTQAQSDWNQTDNTEPDFIKNKPALGSEIHIHTYAEMVALQAASGFTALHLYIISDATSGTGFTPPILVQAFSTNALYSYAIGLGNPSAPLSSRQCSLGIYVLSSNTFYSNEYQSLTLAQYLALPVSKSAPAIFQISGTSVGTIVLQEGTIITRARGMVGIYSAVDDKFSPSGGVEFRVSLSAAQIQAGGLFDITELPAVTGYFWRYTEVDVRYTHNTTPFDGGAQIALVVDGISRGQFSDDGSILSSAATVFGSLTKNDFNSVQILKATGAKGQVHIDTPSTVGDGTLVIYGSAKLIKA
jgi:hypothetical protein